MDRMSNGAQPEWVVNELPSQYADVARQIEALKQEALKYEGVAGVVWRSGDELTAAVRDLFEALNFQTEIMDSGSNYDLRVDLQDGRRLLVEVVSGSERIGRKSPQIAQILRALQEDANEKDRVVLVANLFGDKPVNSRPDDQVTVDALRLIQGLGANFIPTTSLFRIWKSSLDDVGQAQRTIVNLHSMDGGIFR
jgi:hypothetical protein